MHTAVGYSTEYRQRKAHTYISENLYMPGNPTGPWYITRDAIISHIRFICASVRKQSSLKIKSAYYGGVRYT